MHTLEVQARYIILHILNSPQWVQIISEGVFSFIFCSSETSLFHSFAHHCKFLGYWSTQNSVWRILQRFSCLLDEGIKVIHTKHFKHWPYTVAHTFECVCSKILNNGLNHGFFLLLFKLISCPINWIACVLAYLNFIFEF